MTVLKWIIFWPVATNVMLVATAVVLSLPFATVIGLAFVVELAVFAAYGMIAGLRYLGRPRQQRHEYRRRWQPEPRLDGDVIRVVGEVVDDVQPSMPLVLRPQASRQQLGAVQRLALPAPEE